MKGIILLTFLLLLFAVWYFVWKNTTQSRFSTAQGPNTQSQDGSSGSVQSPEIVGWDFCTYVLNSSKIEIYPKTVSGLTDLYQQYLDIDSSSEAQYDALFLNSIIDKKCYLGLDDYDIKICTMLEKNDTQWLQTFQYEDQQDKLFLFSTFEWKNLCGQSDIVCNRYFWFYNSIKTKKIEFPESIEWEPDIVFYLNKKFDEKNYLKNLNNLFKNECKRISTKE